MKNAAESRKIVCLSGTQTLKRNYHYCGDCRLGFHPRDIELGLSKTGEFSPQLEKRILDFGVNDTYEECVDRFSVHYEMRLSSNAFRQVVKRMGGQIEECSSDFLQLELFEAKRSPAQTLYVMEDRAKSRMPMGCDAQAVPKSKMTNKVFRTITTLQSA